jgi:hypothetical protein
VEEKEPNNNNNKDTSNKNLFIWLTILLLMLGGAWDSGSIEPNWPTSDYNYDTDRGTVRHEGSVVYPVSPVTPIFMPAIFEHIPEPVTASKRIITFEPDYPPTKMPKLVKSWREEADEEENECVLETKE